MKSLEDVLGEFRKSLGIRLIRRDMSELERDGVHCDGMCLRAANITVIDSRIRDQRYFNVVDAHECGHHLHLGDDLLTVAPLMAQKEEALAEREAAAICLAPDRMVEACLSGCETDGEFADALGITIDALRRWLDIMQNRYGERPVRTGDYEITFRPLPLRVQRVSAG